MKHQLTFFYLLLFFSSLFFNSAQAAKEFSYQGKVEGMVCAFCVYNVSNKIRGLPGVQKNSVNLDLESGQLEFVSTQMVKKEQVAKLFKNSGFSLTELNRIEKKLLTNVEFSKITQISVSFSSENLKKIIPVLDEIGNLASQQMSFLSVKAPASIELELLKPLIAGRQQTIKVKFVTTDSNVASIKMFYRK